MSERHLQRQIDALRGLVVELLTGEGAVLPALSLEQYAALIGRAPSTLKRKLRKLRKITEGREAPDPKLLRELPEFTVPPWGDPYVTIEALRRHVREHGHTTDPTSDPDLERRLEKALGR